MTEKGWLGEIGISITAKIALPSKQYHKFNNVTLETDRGTTQIDHVIISAHGIFVVETKFMAGWIYGSEHDRQWTQKFPNRSFKFQNPLRQNYAHVKALEAIFPDISQDVFKSVISMCGEHKIKTAMPVNVTRGVWYIKYVRSFKNKVLTDAQVQLACDTIKQKRLPVTRETQKAHIASLKERHKNH